MLNFFFHIASLDNPRKPRFSSKDSSNYFFNPCSSFKCGTIESAVAIY